MATDSSVERMAQAGNLRSMFSRAVPHPVAFGSGVADVARVVVVLTLRAYGVLDAEMVVVMLK
jgi:hypothetical protein